MSPLGRTGWNLASVLNRPVRRPGTVVPSDIMAGRTGRRENRPSRPGISMTAGWPVSAGDGIFTVPGSHPKSPAVIGRSTAQEPSLNQKCHRVNTQGDACAHADPTSVEDTAHESSDLTELDTEDEEVLEEEEVTGEEQEEEEEEGNEEGNEQDEPVSNDGIEHSVIVSDLNRPVRRPGTAVPSEILPGRTGRRQDRPSRPSI
ncbi:hypothetical protein BDD12DRAFT_895364 [Trichophaea hybrida]|nr:hypothetical protein BDD12DRAFT_895364 [Trichophaea hybrida]